MERDIYHGRLKLNGEEHEKTPPSGQQHAMALAVYSATQKPSRCSAKIPVAARSWRERELTLKMRLDHAEALINAGGCA